MDFLFLMIACLFFSVQFVFQKCFQKNTKGGFAISIWNQFTMYITMALYLTVTAGFIKEFSLPSLGYSLLYAVSGLTCSVSSLFAMRYGKMSVVTTFCLLGGMVLPFFYGILFLKEPMTLGKVLGILVLIGSMAPAMLAKEEGSGEKSGSKGKFILFCSLVFAGNGMVSVASKAHQISPNAIDTDSFVLQNALVCLCFATVILIVRTILAAKGGAKAPVKTVFYEIGKKPMTGKLFAVLVALAACYALCNGLGNIFSLRCALTMDSSIQFPLLSGVVIFLTAVFGWLFFKEKIGRSNLISLALTLVGIGLFMLPA